MSYCKLYDPPYNQKRIGCVLCPMTRNVKRHMELWPKLCAAWERAVKGVFNPEIHREKYGFQSDQEYWEWWIDRTASSPGINTDPVLFEDNPEIEDTNDD